MRSPSAETYLLTIAAFLTLVFASSRAWSQDSSRLVTKVTAAVQGCPFTVSRLRYHFEIESGAVLSATSGASAKAMAVVRCGPSELEVVFLDEYRSARRATSLPASAWPRWFALTLVAFLEAHQERQAREAAAARAGQMEAARQKKRALSTRTSTLDSDEQPRLWVETSGGGDFFPSRDSWFAGADLAFGGPLFMREEALRLHLGGRIFGGRGSQSFEEGDIKTTVVSADFLMLLSYRLGQLDLVGALGFRSAFVRFRGSPAEGSAVLGSTQRFAWLAPFLDIGANIDVGGVSSSPSRFYVALRFRVGYAILGAAAGIDGVARAALEKAWLGGSAGLGMRFF